MGMLRAAGGVAGELAGLVPTGIKIANQVFRDGDVTLPRAPKTMLNGPVGGARRFAAQSWAIDRIQGVAKQSGTTLNDVVLAMVSGALREYLLEQNALPDEPMTAMVPVSLALRAESAGKESWRRQRGWRDHRQPRDRSPARPDPARGDRRVVASGQEDHG